jgi:hypothetical protein
MPTWVVWGNRFWINYNFIILHPSLKIPLCGKRSKSQTSLHVTCHDVITKVSQLVTNINHIGLSMLHTKQHHIVGGTTFGWNWANWIDHLWMAMLGSCIGEYGPRILTLFCTLGSMRCDSQASFLAHTLASPGLGRKPKARLRHYLSTLLGIWPM